MNNTYIIRTDAVMQDVTAVNLDAAVAQFAESEGFAARTAEEFAREIDAIDGAWCWIDGPDGREFTAGPQPH